MDRVKRPLVYDRKLGRLRPMGLPPVMTSEKLGWRGLLLEHQRLPRLDPVEVVPMHILVVMYLADAAIEFTLHGETRCRELTHGDVVLFPSMSASVCRSDSSLDFLVLSIEESFFSAACAGVTGNGDVNLPLRLGIKDPFIQGVFLALRREMEAGGTAGRAYGESLAAILAVHLAVCYGSQQPRAIENQASGLSARSLRQAMEFIDRNLANDFSLRQLASAAGLSAFHFARQFKRSVGLSPHQFVLKRRVQRAQRLMLGRDLSLAQIAVEVGFCDQSHLTHHFRRITGTTPRGFLNRLV